MDPWLRVSLLARMAASVCTLGTVALTSLPRVSAVAPFRLQRSPRPHSSSGGRSADGRPSGHTPR